VEDGGSLAVMADAVKKTFWVVMLATYSIKRNSAVIIAL